MRLASHLVVTPDTIYTVVSTLINRYINTVWKLRYWEETSPIDTLYATNPMCTFLGFEPHPQL